LTNQSVNGDDSIRERFFRFATQGSILAPAGQIKGVLSSDPQVERATTNVVRNPLPGNKNSEEEG
jgi:hypothetical protein